MKEHHSAHHVTEPCAGGNWKLSWIIQAVMSTKTNQVAFHNRTTQASVQPECCSPRPFRQPSFLLLKSFYPYRQEITKYQWENSRGEPSLTVHKKPRIPFTAYWLLASRNKEMEPTTQRNTFKHPVFYTVLKMPFNKWRVKCICVFIKSLNSYI